MRNSISLVITIIFFMTSFALFTVYSGEDLIKKTEGNNQYYTAGNFFRKPVDTNELISRYQIVNATTNEAEEQVDPIKILIVPGHDDESRGAHYKDLYEVDLNRVLAKELYNLLREEDAFHVQLASSEDGYHRRIQRYFDEEEEAIKEFRSEYQAEMKRLVEEGKVILKNDTFHNAAAEDVSLKLYGINKYANDNDFDILIHVHFNDQGKRKRDKKGDYEGFSIYVPESQFPNSEVSKKLGKEILDRFSEFFPVSNNPIEESGLIEDQELIAIGSHGTLDSASVLIEYGYIYEDRFNDENVLDEVLKGLAYQTYVSIKNFFGDEEKE